LLSIVLPTYNERDNISPLVHEILRHATPPFEIIIVDDDSPDKTWEVAQHLEETMKEVRLLRRRGRRGLTEALNAGLKNATGEECLWMDADFSMPPQLIPQLQAALKTYPVVIGSRYIDGGEDARGTFFPMFLSRIFNRATTCLLGGIRDYTSGFCAIRKEVWDTLGLSGHYGEYCVRFLHQARRHGYPVYEIPYTCSPRKQGASKTFASPFQLLKYGKAYAWTLLSLWIKP